MSLLEKLGVESEIKAERKKEVEKEVAKQREYDKLGLIGGV